MFARLGSALAGVAGGAGSAGDKQKDAAAAAAAKRRADQDALRAVSTHDGARRARAGATRAPAPALFIPHSAHSNRSAPRPAPPRPPRRPRPSSTTRP